jgi:mRNA-degrading endonuclease RelE of RelBE toxin-antitoxin system
MDPIEKALAKLSEKEKKIVKDILDNLQKRIFKGLDMKKLKGHDVVFRVRKGNIRILYRTDNTNKIFLLAIERRNDNTYKF